MRCLVSAIVAFCVFAAGTSCPGFAQTYLETEHVTVATMPTSTEMLIDAGRNVRIQEPGTDYLRLGLKIVGGTSGASYSLVIRNAQARELARLSSAELTASAIVHTPLFFTDTVTLALEGDPPASLKIIVSEVIKQVYRGSLQPLSPVLSTKPYAEFAGHDEKHKKIAAAVAKLMIGEGYVCSGFLISENILITANHCVSESYGYQPDALGSFQHCEDIAIQFDYNTKDIYSRTARTSCLTVIRSDPKLDYAMIELNPDSVLVNGKRRAPLMIATSWSDQEDVALIHYPVGLPFAYSSSCRAFLMAQSNLIGHDCGSMSGSSGSPLIDASDRVIGLHIGGGYPRNLPMIEIEKRTASGEIFLNEARALKSVPVASDGRGIPPLPNGE